jgi:hypothetical protein
VVAPRAKSVKCQLTTRVYSLKRRNKTYLLSNFSQFILIFDIVPPLWKWNGPIDCIPWLWVSGADESKEEEAYQQMKLARERGHHGG